MTPREDLSFRRQLDGLLPWRLRIAALTAFAANGSFVLFDSLTLHGDVLFYRTLGRIFFAPLLLTVGLLASRGVGQRHPQALVLILAATLSLQLAATGVLLPPADSVGFFPALLFFCTFLPLPRGRTAAMAMLFVVAFLAVNLSAGLWPLGAIVKHAGNLTIAGVVGVVCAAMAEKLARSEFLARRQLAEANRHLEEARKVKDQFFTDVSHELRTPLTTALLVLEGKSGDAPQAVRPLRRLQKLVDEMLLLSRVDAGAALRSNDITDVAATLGRIVDEFSSGFTGKGLRLAAELCEGTAYARIGADALERVAVNLIGNALKYTPSGGRVLVRVRVEDDEVLLEVEDDGPGIAAADLTRIFDRFVRVESRSGAPGIGVGLAIARELTELHAGTLDCESDRVRGTVFRARWPRCDDPPELAVRSPLPRVEEAVAAALDGAATGGPEPHGPRAQGPEGAPVVLVIEDHHELASRIAGSLAPGLRTYLVHDGAEGVELARRLRPDLIICDVLLPSMHGHEVVRALRADPSTQAVPILLLSALSEREHVLSGLNAGADDTMAKPFDATMLRARVDALLRLKRRRDGAGMAAQVLRSFCQGMSLALEYDAVALLSANADGALALTACGGDEALVFGAGSGAWGAADARWATQARPTELTGRADLPSALAHVALAVMAPVCPQPKSLLLLLSRKRRALRPNELPAIAVAASLAAVMLERERSVEALAQLADEKQRLSSATLSGQDAERRRLALELHDGPGQTLVGALLHLDVAIRAGQPDDGLRLARTLTAQALDDLRSMTRELHPPSLSQHGLHQTLRTLAASLTSERMRVTAEIAPDAPHELPMGTALGLYRIAQAALANTLRHAQARSAVLRLRLDANDLVLEVADDGVGFIPSRTEHGVGVPGMRERAASLGGSISIDSDLGRGTVVRVALPLSLPS